MYDIRGIDAFSLFITFYTKDIKLTTIERCFNPELS